MNLKKGTPGSSKNKLYTWGWPIRPRHVTYVYNKEEEKEEEEEEEKKGEHQSKLHVEGKGDTWLKSTLRICSLSSDFTSSITPQLWIYSDSHNKEQNKTESIIPTASSWLPSIPRHICLNARNCVSLKFKIRKGRTDTTILSSSSLSWTHLRNLRANVQNAMNSSRINQTRKDTSPCVSADVKLCALPLQQQKTKKTPRSEPASELYRPSDRRLSAKLVPTFADTGCHVVSVTDPYGSILCFLHRSRYFSIK
jgi:hypothetical protein